MYSNIFENGCWCCCCCVCCRCSGESVPAVWVSVFLFIMCLIADKLHTAQYTNVTTELLLFCFCFFSHKRDVTLIKKYFKIIFRTYSASRLMICWFSGSSAWPHMLEKHLKLNFFTVESNGLCKSLCYRESFPICRLHKELVQATYRETFVIALWQWSPVHSYASCSVVHKAEKA